MAPEFEGQVAVVTGGAKGIGRACAERFLSAGAAGVVIADVDPQASEECARSLDPSGKRVLAVRTDVAVAGELKAMVERALARFERIDALVTSAGIAGRNGAMETQTEADLDRIWAVNVKGTYFACAAVHPHMARRGYGRIVTIASIAGKEGNPGLVPYSMTKAAVIGFTKAYAKEVAQSGILVNSIAPAVIETDILRQVTEEVKRYMIQKIPMGRVGRPEEVAELVLFLSSQRLSFSTGFCFDLSGGRATY
jgi:NAD(P)-dependent dehydrogenase (short-subunit alcohol dehydrogenase family)